MIAKFYISFVLLYLVIYSFLFIGYIIKNHQPKNYLQVIRISYKLFSVNFFDKYFDKII
jgi:hypothetical protein